MFCKNSYLVSRESGVVGRFLVDSPVMSIERGCRSDVYDRSFLHRRGDWLEERWHLGHEICGLAPSALQPFLGIEPGSLAPLVLSSAALNPVNKKEKKDLFSFLFQLKLYCII